MNSAMMGKEDIKRKTERRKKKKTKKNKKGQEEKKKEKRRKKEGKKKEKRRKRKETEEELTLPIATPGSFLNSAMMGKEDIACYLLLSGGYVRHGSVQCSVV